MCCEIGFHLFMAGAVQLISSFQAERGWRSLVKGKECASLEWDLEHPYVPLTQPIHPYPLPPPT